MLDIPVEAVNVVIFLKIHFTRIMGRLCSGVPSTMYVERVQYIRHRYSIIFVKDSLDEIVMLSVII